MTNTATVVLEKHDESELSPRILELRKKIQDSAYLDNAVQRIAQVISRRLVEEPDSVFVNTSGVMDFQQGGYDIESKQ